MNVIILGCGRQGALLAEMLQEEGCPVTLIDRNPDSFGNMEGFTGKKVIGDGTLEKTLVKAGIKECEAFVAITGNDGVNLMASQIARGIYQVKRVVCRIYDPARTIIYSDLGLETINFSLTGAQLLKTTITGAGIAKKFQLGDGTAVALEVKIGSESCGKKIKELEIPGEFRIGSIIRNLKVIIPDGETEIQEDDHIFGIVRINRLADLKARLGVREEKDVLLEKED